MDSFVDSNDSTLAPAFEVQIDGSDGQHNKFLEEAEFESNDTMYDKLTLKFRNIGGQVSDSELFSVGKELNFYGGYVDNLYFLGRFVIYSVQDLRVGKEMPTVEVIAFTKDYIMSKNEPKHTKSQPSNKTEKLRVNRVWPEVTDLSTIIYEIASDYSFLVDIDPAERSLMEAGTASIAGGKKVKGKSPKPTITDNIVQPGGVSDLAMCTMIANEIGYLFWVDGDEDGNWTLHFKNPETTHIQKIGHSFSWDWEGEGDILEFDGEQLLEGVDTLTVQFIDPKTKKLITVEVNPLNEDSNDIKPQANKTYEVVEETEFTREEAVIKEPVAPNAIWIEVGQRAHKVITNRVFKSIEDVQAWATKYFKEYGDQFKKSEVKVIGAPDMIAFSVINYNNLGGGWDGDHYIFQAIHTWSSNGYEVVINARKILGTGNVDISLPDAVKTLLESPFVRKVKSQILETLNL